MTQKGETAGVVTRLWYEAVCDTCSWHSREVTCRRAVVKEAETHEEMYQHMTHVRSRKKRGREVLQ